jgi:hypothetical protein
MLEDVRDEKEEKGEGVEVVRMIRQNRGKEFHDFILIGLETSRRSWRTDCSFVVLTNERIRRILS